MTPDEELAVKAVEARLRGMHPAWVKWFAYYKNGYYLLNHFPHESDAFIQSVYAVPPNPNGKHHTIREEIEAGRYVP